MCMYICNLYLKYIMIWNINSIAYKIYTYTWYIKKVLEAEAG